jgi:hypothetical protein
MKPGTRPAPCIAFPGMGRMGEAHPLPKNGKCCHRKYVQAPHEKDPRPPSFTLKTPTLPHSKLWKTGNPVLSHPQGIAENP